MQSLAELVGAVRGEYGPGRTKRPSLQASAAVGPQLGARALCRAATRTGQVAGDGRITTILLTWQLVEEGVRTLAPGASGTALRRGLGDGLTAALDALAEQAHPSEATVARVRGGSPVVPGGGVALLRCVAAVENAAAAARDEEAIGIGLVASAVAAPLRQLARNAGADPDQVVARVAAAAGPWGFDAAVGEFGDLVMRGIVEPVRVARVALTHAVRTASTLLLADAVLG